MLQGKNTANEATDRFVRNFDAWCRGAQSASEQSQLCELSRPIFGFTMREFSRVGGYTENPEKPQNCQTWGVGACSGMGACSGQYGINMFEWSVTSYMWQPLSGLINYKWQLSIEVDMIYQASSNVLKVTKDIYTGTACYIRSKTADVALVNDNLPSSSMMVTKTYWGFSETVRLVSVVLIMTRNDSFCSTISSSRMLIWIHSCCGTPSNRNSVVLSLTLIL